MILSSLAVVNGFLTEFVIAGVIVFVRLLVDVSDPLFSRLVL